MAEIPAKNSFRRNTRIAGVACLSLGVFQLWALTANLTNAREHRGSSKEEITEACKDYAWSVGKDGIYRTINPALWLKTWCEPYSKMIRDADMAAYNAKLRRAFAEADAREKTEQAK